MKSIKEVHFLSLQLQKIIEDNTQGSITLEFNLSTDAFEHPSEE